MPESLPLETPHIGTSREPETEDFLDYCAAIEALEEFQENGEIRPFVEFVEDLDL